MSIGRRIQDKSCAYLNIRALRDPKVTKTLNDQLMEVVANTPEEFAREMREEQAMWKPVIDAVGLKMD